MSPKEWHDGISGVRSWCSAMTLRKIVTPWVGVAYSTRCFLHSNYKPPCLFWVWLKYHSVCFLALTDPQPQLHHSCISPGSLIFNHWHPDQAATKDVINASFCLNVKASNLSKPIDSVRYSRPAENLQWLCSYRTHKSEVPWIWEVVNKSLFL